MNARLEVGEMKSGGWVACIWIGAQCVSTCYHVSRAEADRCGTARVAERRFTGEL